jgi:hypothetical protein
MPALTLIEATGGNYAVAQALLGTRLEHNTECVQKTDYTTRLVGRDVAVSEEPWQITKRHFES